MRRTQPFPAGALIFRAGCSGVYCGGDGDFTVKSVVRAYIGPTPEAAQRNPLVTLCADCLADFAVASSPDMPTIHVPEVVDGAITFRLLERFHVYAEGTDGHFHEVRGEVP